MSFDANKQFYPLVLAAAAQYHGLIDLLSRGVRQHVDSALPALRQDDIDYICSGIVGGYGDHVRDVLGSQNAPLIGNQHFGSVLDAGPKVDTSHLADEIYSRYSDSLRVFNAVSAGSLLITCWEITSSAHTADPMWEFMRHCRNAAAHGGCFSLRHREPTRFAKWRSLEVVPGLQGSRLFVDDSGNGFIGPGDVLYLLLDIEQAFL